MKRITVLGASLLILVSILGNSIPAALALQVTTSPPPVTSPDILVTSIIEHPSQPLIDDLEIYSQADTPVNLTNWSFSFGLSDTGACKGKTVTVGFPDGWLLPQHYLTFQRDGDQTAPGSFSLDTSFLSTCSAPWIDSVKILNGNNIEQTINIADATTLAPTFSTDKNGNSVEADKIVQHHQRNNSPNSTRTLDGTFLDDYKISSITPSTTIYSDQLYLPPASPQGLKIVEVLPNSANCSPLDNGLNCSDLVKLYNSSSSPLDLSGYRLRTSYGGNNSSSSNTISLNGVLGSGKYSVVNTKNDGSPLSLTDSGGYVWLEDAYGAQTYQPLIEYPDAGSATKVGWAWALKGDAWQWSSLPTTESNVFPAITESSSALSATTSLSPCAPDQFRNPATNRCKSITSSSSSLTACAANQERNPATNRCRDVLGASVTLTPCKPGQTRNPATNRCHKDASASIASIQDIKAPVKSSSGNLKWAIALMAVLIALGYGFYEWRHDVSLAWQKIKEKKPVVKLRK